MVEKSPSSVEGPPTGGRASRPEKYPEESNRTRSPASVVVRIGLVLQLGILHVEIQKVRRNDPGWFLTHVEARKVQVGELVRPYIGTSLDVIPLQEAQERRDLWFRAEFPHMQFGQHRRKLVELLLWEVLRPQYEIGKQSSDFHERTSL